MSRSRFLSVADVRAAHGLIRPLIHRTLVITSDAISQAVSRDDLRIKMFFKCENLQKSGSFKFRGASNFIAQLSNSDLEKGVVAISTGNFGFAVAKAAAIEAKTRSLDIRASVVLPNTAASSKIAGAREYGAKVVVAGSSPEDRELAARKILQETGATLVGPMDDPKIVLGQGTATLEFLDQVTETGHTLNAIVLPSATGGILAGAAIACKDIKCMVYGCEPKEGGPDLQRGLETGNLVNPKNQTSIADGLRASTAKGNFEIICGNVDGFHTVEEHHIRQAWAMLIERLSPSIGLVEPSAAVALALVLFNERFRDNLKQLRLDCVNVGIILTGGNTTVSQVKKGLGGGERGFGDRSSCDIAI